MKAEKHFKRQIPYSDIFHLNCFSVKRHFQTAKILDLIGYKVHWYFTDNSLLKSMQVLMKFDKISRLEVPIIQAFHFAEMINLTLLQNEVKVCHSYRFETSFLYVLKIR